MQADSEIARPGWLNLVLFLVIFRRILSHMFHRQGRSIDTFGAYNTLQYQLRLKISKYNYTIASAPTLPITRFYQKSRLLFFVDS